MTDRRRYLHPICPATMRTHPTDEPTCPQCERHVRAYLAWYLALPPGERGRQDAGAWEANETTHSRALDLHHAETNPAPRHTDPLTEPEIT